MQLTISTIGVYGFTEENFFRTLLDNNIQVLIDVRQRRGLRGKRYAFCNSQRLQERLRQLNIEYIHLKELAPYKELRIIQHEADKESGVEKRKRRILHPRFIDAYKRKILQQFTPEELLCLIPAREKKIVLFCVEKNPAACHRSIISKYLSDTMSAEERHILPCTD